MNPDSIPEMKDYSYYEGRDLSRPTKDQFTTWYIYNNGALVWKGDYTEKANFAARMQDNPCYVWQKAIDFEEYKKAAANFNKEYGSRGVEFRLDLLASAGLDPEHPKVKKLYDLAWEYGHASGLEEVRYHFEELLPLIL